MMSSDYCDWQISFKKIRERGGHILQSEQWTDCSFLVGSDQNYYIVKAHKLILAMASPIFEAMFYGSIAESNECIHIVDVRPEVFKSLLEYIYTDKIKVESFDFACELYYTANKYMLIYLEEECIKYLFSELSPENACRGYELAKLFDITYFMEECLEVICTKTNEVLSATSFNTASISTVITVFDQQDLNISSELVLFKALEEYVKVNNMKSAVSQQLMVDQILPSPQIDINSSRIPVNPSHASDDKQLLLKRPQNDGYPPAGSFPPAIIKDAVKKIRFLTMTPREFAEGPAKSNLLSRSEILAILLNISSRYCEMPLPEGFSTSKKPRINKNIRVVFDKDILNRAMCIHSVPRI